jgi:NCS2 family nucleobase:cation symporter-2
MEDFMKEKQGKGGRFASASIENIYQLDGLVPIGKAIPFGLQHVLAMFVSNLAPIIIVTGTVGLSQEQRTFLLQNAMFIAGLASLLQLYPLGLIGAKLPVIMGVSFTFVSCLIAIGLKYGYGGILGAVIVGGCIEGTLGLFAKYWKHFIAPIVSASVVTCIGFSLLAVGATSFAGGNGNPNLGNGDNMLVGTITLIACLVWNSLAKSFWKQLSVLFGLIVGYAAAIAVGIVDFSGITQTSIIAIPHILPIKPEFHASAIISLTIFFLVSATETIGDTSAVVKMGLGRDITEKEIRGALACDGYSSALSGIFGTLPVTSFSQNVGLIAMTKVVNRFTIMTGAAALIIAGLFPPIGAFFASLPQAVLGGCTVMMFGSIVISGFRMISDCGMTQRNITIASLTLAISLGFTQLPEMWQVFPQLVRDVFSANSVSCAFVVSMVLNAVLPKNMEIHRQTNAG